MVLREWLCRADGNGARVFWAFILGRWNPLGAVYSYGLRELYLTLLANRRTIDLLSSFIVETFRDASSLFKGRLCSLLYSAVLELYFLWYLGLGRLCDMVSNYLDPWMVSSKEDLCSWDSARGTHLNLALTVLRLSKFS